MKKIIGNILFCFFLIANSSFGQEVKFSVSIDRDSVLFDNTFKVTFTLENAKGTEFTPPAFEAFTQVSGQSSSTKMSIINGEMSQLSSYSFYLEPKEIGRFYIEPASILAGDIVLETLPLAVFVLDNPDGIKQKPKRKGNDPGFLFDQFDMDLPPQFNWDTPPSQKQKKKKKKRKTFRL